MRSLLIAIALVSCAAAEAQTDWPSYGGDSHQTRYSSLKQIDRSNVSKLEVAWQYDTADGTGDPQTQPIVVHGVLYGVTPRHKIFAVDAATGKELWRFDSGTPQRGANRGVVYWESGEERRILAGVKDRIYALDARTGKVIATFGVDGAIDLREGLGRDAAKQSYVLTTPGIIYKDLLIVGGRLPEALPSPPGDIRASTSARASSDGNSTPSPTRANWATKPGPGMLGTTPVRPTIGRAWLLTWSAGLFLRPPVPQQPISTERTALATTSSPIPFWP